MYIKHMDTFKQTVNAGQINVMEIESLPRSIEVRLGSLATAQAVSA